MRKIKCFAVWVIFSVCMGHATAQTIEFCNELPVKYFYINGMYTEKKDAEKNGDAIKEKLDRAVKFELIYNRYDGYLVDLWEVFRLKLAESAVVGDFSFKEMFESLHDVIGGVVADAPNSQQQIAKQAYLDAHAKFEANTSGEYIDEPLQLMENQVKSLLQPKQMALFLTHSQGNLYFPWLKKRLKAVGYDESYLSSIGLANPARNTWSAYFNHKNDLVLKALSIFYPVLTGNFDNDTATVPYHDLQGTYLYGDVITTLQKTIDNDLSGATAAHLSYNKEALRVNIQSSVMFGPEAKVNPDIGYRQTGQFERTWFATCGQMQPGVYTITSPNTYGAPPNTLESGQASWSLSIQEKPTRSESFTIWADPSKLSTIPIATLEVKNENGKRWVTINP